MRALALVVAICALVACAKSRADRDDECVKYDDGAEKGACYGNGTCNDGLMCLSELCVRPEPADCNAVARKLGYLSLDNYAPRDEREAFEREMAVACAEAMVSKTDGECILRANNRTTLQACPQPLVFANCQRIFAHLRNLAEANAEIGRALRRGEDAFVAECEKQALTRADEACILRSVTEQELEACLPNKR